MILLTFACLFLSLLLCYWVLIIISICHSNECENCFKKWDRFSNCPKREDKYNHEAIDYSQYTNSNLKR